MCILARSASLPVSKDIAQNNGFCYPADDMFDINRICKYNEHILNRHSHVRHSVPSWVDPYVYPPCLVVIAGKPEGSCMNEQIKLPALL